MQTERGRPEKYLVPAFLLFAPVLVYLYFLNWKTGTIYGDDLLIYHDYQALNGTLEKINLPNLSHKYRPVHGLNIHWMISLFGRHLHAYYIFNVLVQSACVFATAWTVRLITKSALLAVLAGLLVGFSRFSFFSMTQLMNGGALEGMGFLFALLTTASLVRALQEPVHPGPGPLKNFWLSLLFANLAMYTHERYLVLFPVIALAALLSPVLRGNGWKGRGLIASAAVISILLNVAIKIFIIRIPFMVGTSGTEISVSSASILQFLKEALLSVFNINEGPQHLAGIDFSQARMVVKAAAILFVLSAVFILVAYLLRVDRAYREDESAVKNRFAIFLCLSCIFGATLLPAVVTIRLEHRWLVAPMAISVMMAVLAITDLPLRTNQRNLVVFGYLLVGAFVNHNYLYKGAQNIYLVHSEKLASRFETALAADQIRPETKKIYLWEQKRDPNVESGVNWVLGGGYLFTYLEDPKTFVFEDSVIHHTGDSLSGVAHRFDPQYEQLILMRDSLVDITPLFLQDSLRTLDAAIAAGFRDYNRINLSGKEVRLSADDLSQLPVKGFYDAEGIMRWTNGNAEIGFPGGLNFSDSIVFVLETTLPQKAAAVVPVLHVEQGDGTVVTLRHVNRSGDTFRYVSYASGKGLISRARLTGEVFDASPDVRVLSFPFISITIRR
ncbi:MAG: hypothetical protein EOO09_06360 [Chitinophagaceae bacterium]|nr:MAG: hypothetical protein EOO09_06360 [Chitinophagaceae bacterium]